MTKKHKPRYKSKELHYMEGWRDALHTAIVQIDDYKFQQKKKFDGAEGGYYLDIVFEQVLKMLNILREEGGVQKK